MTLYVHAYIILMICALVFTKDAQRMSFQKPQIKDLGTRRNANEYDSSGRRKINRDSKGATEGDDITYTMTSQLCFFDRMNQPMGRRIRQRRNVENSVVESPARWKKKILTYRIHSNPASLGIDKTRHAIYRAFRIWAKHSDLAFVEVTGEETADLNLRFLVGDHGDGEFQAFDGPGKHLAHAHFPCSGEIHFDKEERWSLRSGKTRSHVVTKGYGRYDGAPISLVMVGAHEIGHALGLRHNYDKASIMYPTYSTKQDDVIGGIRLRASDIEDLQILYENGTISVFKGRYLWKIIWNEFPRLVKLRTTFPVSKPRVDAACYSVFSKRTYVFSGHKYWRFYDGKLETGYPRFTKSASLPSKPDAAVSLPNVPRLYVFKKAKYYIFDEIHERVMERYPRRIETIFPGIQLPIDAVVSHGEKVYFISGKVVYVYEEKELWDRIEERKLAPKCLKKETLNSFYRMNSVMCKNGEIS